MSGSIDINVLLRLLLNDVPDQHLAAKELIEQAPHQFAVADTVIIEVVFVLERYYRFSRLNIAEAVDGLMKLEKLIAIGCYLKMPYFYLLNIPTYLLKIAVYQPMPTLITQNLCGLLIKN